MKIKINFTPIFKKEYKHLKKKYRNLPKELENLQKTLQKEPQTGINLGNGLYKIRLANPNKNKGKSAGFRIITFVIKNDEITLLRIYDKSEKATIKKKVLQEMTTLIKQNLK